MVRYRGLGERPSRQRIDIELIHRAAGLVDVTWRPDLAAVHLKWFSENDEGTRVRDAVMAALDWEANTLRRFGDRIRARVCASPEEARAFLTGDV